MNKDKLREDMKKIIADCEEDNIKLYKSKEEIEESELENKSVIRGAISFKIRNNNKMIKRNKEQIIKIEKSKGMKR